MDKFIKLKVFTKTRALGFGRVEYIEPCTHIINTRYIEGVCASGQQPGSMIRIKLQHDGNAKVLEVIESFKELEKLLGIKK